MAINVVINGVEYMPKTEIKEAALLDLIETLKIDAGRYKQLRDNSAQQDVSIQLHAFGEESKWLYGKEADECIDEIIKKRGV